MIFGEQKLPVELVFKLMSRTQYNTATSLVVKCKVPDAKFCQKLVMKIVIKE